MPHRSLSRRAAESQDKVRPARFLLPPYKTAVVRCRGEGIPSLQDDASSQCGIHAGSSCWPQRSPLARTGLS